MKPAPFEYFAPDSLEEALELKSEHGDEMKALAGGQSLIPAMNFRVAQPSVLVDLNRIGELDYIEERQGAIHIGAMTRQSTVEKSKLIEQHAPLLYEGMPYIAHPQIRNRGTLGGSIAHADPAAELPVLALALEAEMQINSKTGSRKVPAKQFFQGYFTVDIQANELLTEVILPRFPENTGWSFQEISRRTGDYGMAGVAALVTLEEGPKCSKAKMVYLNVGDGPVDAVQAAESLSGATLDSKTIEAAAIIAAEKDIMPFGNIHASVEYQRHLSKILTERALSQAFERAQEQL